MAAPLSLRFPVRPASPDAPTRRADGPLVRPFLGFVLAVVVALTAIIAAPEGARATPAQDPGTSTAGGFPAETSTTTVVTTEVATTSAASTTVEAEQATSGPGSTRVADENRKIWLVVAALVAVAIALTLLTIRYWRRTRPIPAAIGAPSTAADIPPAPDLFGARAASTGSDRQSELDPPADDAPSVDDATPDVTDADAAWQPTGPSNDTASEPAGGGPPNEALPVVVADAGEALEAGTGEPRISRRAVAGADHAGADESWEPRGTGEHDRVVLPAATRRARPTPTQRAAAFDAAKRS